MPHLRDCDVQDSGRQGCQSGAVHTYDLELSSARRHIAYYWVLQLVNPMGAAIDQARQLTMAQNLDRLVSAPDFMATLCLALGMDIHQEFLAPGLRPIPLADKSAKPINELLS